MKKPSALRKRNLVAIDNQPSMALIPAGQHLPEKVASAMAFIESIGAAPMRDRILVCRADSKQKIGSIIIPDIAQETQDWGIVVAIGSGHYLEGKEVPLDVKPGDVVFFNKYAGTEKQFGTHTLLRLREEEIEFRADGQKCMQTALAGKKEGSQ